jgi:hypothetical protein
MPAFEETYLDVLQNIEFAIVSVYRENPDLLDYDVDKAVNLLWTEYRNEKQDRTMPAPQLAVNAQKVYVRVKSMCEWRLGRRNLEKDGQPVEMDIKPLTLDEIMACLKRIRKSIELWTKQGGRQGYLYFIDNNSGM